MTQRGPNRDRSKQESPIIFMGSVNRLILLYKDFLKLYYIYHIVGVHNIE